MILVWKLSVRFGKMLWFRLQVVCYNGHAKQYRIDLVQFWMKTVSEKMGKYRKKYKFAAEDGQMNAKREPPLVGVIP